MLLCVLAAAQAETGNFEEATKWQRVITQTGVRVD